MTVTNFDSKLFEAAVLNEHADTLIEFWAPWCVYCRRLQPALEQLAKEQEDLLIGKLNIDDEPELANRYGIEVVPTLLAFRGGQVAGKVVAPGSKAELDAFVREQF